MRDKQAYRGAQHDHDRRPGTAWNWCGFRVSRMAGRCPTAATNSHFPLRPVPRSDLDVALDANGSIVASGSTGANGDGSATASDLEPGIYTCTIVVDP
jgi:hypothetical protein